MSYRKKAFFGIGYLTLLNIFSQFFGLFKLFVIARILAPSDFGIFAIVTAIITTFETLTETGFNYAAIQMNVSIKKIARTLLMVNIARGSLLCLITIVTAPILSYFFKNSDLLMLLLLSSVIPLLRGFINPLTISFQKELEFNKVFLTQFIPIVVTVISSIYFVIYIHSALALLLGLIAGTISEVVSSYFLAEISFKEPIAKIHIKNLFSYGKWITAGGLLTYLSTQIDNLFIGRFFGVGVLGLYDFAFKTANLAFTQITDIVSRVAFPLYVKRKNDKNHLRNLFFQNVIGVSIPAFVIMIPLLLFPKEILQLLFGPKWIAAALPLQILSIYGFFRAAIGPGGPLFLSIGKPDVLTKINTLNFILVIIFLYPFAKMFGVNGVAWSMTLSYLIITPIYIYFSVKYFKN